MLLLLILAFSPLANAAWDIWAFTAVHAVSLLILFVYIISILWSSEGVGARFKIKPVNSLLVMLVAVAVLSCFTAMNKFNARNEIFNLLNYIFLFFIAGRVISEDKSLFNWRGDFKYNSDYNVSKFYFICLILVVGAVLSLVGIYQFSRGREVSSTMVNPNILAGYLVMIIPVAFGMAIRNWASVNKRVLYLLFFTLMLLGLLLTKSLGGIIGMCVGVALVAYLTLGKDFFKKYRYYLVSLVILLIILLIIKLGDVELGNRLSWWEAAVRMIIERPVFGVGPGNYGSVFFNYKVGTLNSLYAHNVFLQTGAEIGVFGLAAFIIVIGLVLRKRNSSDSLLFCGICAVLVHNLMDYNLCIPANAILFWVMLGIINGGKSEKNYKHLFPLDRERKWILTVVVFVMLAGIAIVVIKPFLASRYWVFGNNSVEIALTAVASEKTGKEEKEMQLQALGKAEDYYEKALSMDPLNPLYYSSLADVYMKYYINDGYNSWLDEAIIKLNKAAYFHCCHAPVHKNLALLYQLKMDYGKAIGEIKKAVEYDKNNREYRDILERLASAL